MIVVWRVTQECNLSCPFCGYDRTLERTRHQAPTAPIESFGRILSDFQSLTGRRVLVSWIGGEPLLWGPLESLSLLFTRDYGLRVSTTTNGTPLGSSAMRRQLLDTYAELTVSVDGIGDIHNRLRRWPNGYDRLRDWVSQLAHEKRERGAALKLRANTVLMRQNIDQFPELCHELASWGIEEITFNQLGGNDRPAFFHDNRLQPLHAHWLARCVPRLREELRHKRVTLHGSTSYLHRIEASTHNISLPVDDCQPGEDFLFIDECGRISPCSFTAENYGIPLHELTQAEDLLDLPDRFRTSRCRHRATPCEDCQSTHVFAKFASP